MKTYHPQAHITVRAQYLAQEAQQISDVIHKLAALAIKTGPKT